MLACIQGHPKNYPLDVQNRMNVVESILKHSEAKGIEIPPNISPFSDEIKDLIEKHNETTNK